MCGKGNVSTQQAKSNQICNCMATAANVELVFRSLFWPNEAQSNKCTTGGACALRYAACSTEKYF